MPINHQLKNCLFEFLSNESFSGYEFKDLRKSFITSYPEFSSKKYYSKMYQYIRELASLDLIIIDNRTCTYKYYSNYSRFDLIDLMNRDEGKDKIKKTLTLEYDRVNYTLNQLDNEIMIYEIYLNKFPMLSETILKFTSKRKMEIDLLQCELRAINNLIEAC